MGATYKQHLAPQESLYQGLAVNLGAQYHLGAGGGKSRLQVSPDILPIFPLFFSYYDKHPLGKLASPTASTPIADANVSFFARQYMDPPKFCGEAPAPARRERGGPRLRPLQGLRSSG